LKKQKPRLPRVEFEMTALGGASILAQTARQFGLFELLDAAVSVKVGNRGASEPGSRGPSSRRWPVPGSGSGA